MELIVKKTFHFKRGTNTMQISVVKKKNSGKGFIKILENNLESSRKAVVKQKSVENTTFKN